MIVIEHHLIQLHLKLFMLPPGGSVVQRGQEAPLEGRFAAMPLELETDILGSLTLEILSEVLLLQVDVNVRVLAIGLNVRMAMLFRARTTCRVPVRFDGVRRVEGVKGIERLYKERSFRISCRVGVIGPVFECWRRGSSDMSVALGTVAESVNRCALRGLCVYERFVDLVILQQSLQSRVFRVALL